MRFKKLIRWLHLWLGLASGIVIFIIALTGALWAFETELQDAFYSYRNVTPQSASYAAPSELKAVAQRAFDNKPVKSIVYVANNRAAMVRTWGEEDGKEYNFIAFINPYNATLLHVKRDHNFFDIVIELHTSLMLGEVGRKIIDYSTLIFLVMVISGMILWWPGKRNRVKNSFRIKWKASFKRTNYDLHNVLGFYATWILIFIVLTGLAWGFEWMNQSIYYASSGGAAYKEWLEPLSVSDTNTTAKFEKIEDSCFARAILAYKKPFATAEVFYAQENTGTLLISLNPSAKTFFKTTSYYFDQRTGEQQLQTDFNSQNGGEKVRSMYYDIHVGKILGFPGQLLVFFASLIAASLPITGFLIWRGKNAREKAVALK
jgi:uncharacterized iron-regulated membrane protein